MLLDRDARDTHCASMHIRDKTRDTLVLHDNQGDKALGVSLICVILTVAAVSCVWMGFWIPAIVLLAGVPGAILYLNKTRIETTITFDRSKDRIDLSVKSRKGPEVWDWRLSDLATAEVSEMRRDGASRGVFRPDMIMKDGARVAMRPYHSAGTQSWQTVAAVKLFLGQRLDNAPVGWLPSEEFDRFFEQEMTRLHK
ncbi:MAG: hypothetical protein AAF724_07590 [Pseudomonadota bacterium]